MTITLTVEQILAIGSGLLGIIVSLVIFIVRMGLNSINVSMSNGFKSIVDALGEHIREDFKEHEEMKTRTSNLEKVVFVPFNHHDSPGG